MAPNIRSLNMRKEEENQMDGASVAEAMNQSIELPVYKTQELITALGVFGCFQVCVLHINCTPLLSSVSM